MNEKITILTCNYNKEERLVKRCLDSLREQTYKNFAVIFIENGSTKNILDEKFFDSYSDLEMKVIKLMPNRGVAGGYNAGIRELKTKFFFFLDSDDFLEPNCLEKALDEYVLSGSSMIFVRHYLSYLDGREIPNKFSGETTRLAGRDLVKSVLDWTRGYSNGIIFEDLGTHWGILIDTSAFSNNDDILRPESHFKIGLYEDFTYVISLLVKAGQVTVLNELLYHLNRGSESTSSHFIPVYADEMLEACELIYDSIQSTNDKETKTALANFVMTRFTFLLGHYNDYESYKRRWKKIFSSDFVKWLRYSNCDNFIKSKCKLFVYKHCPKIGYKIYRRKQREQKE